MVRNFSGALLLAGALLATACDNTVDNPLDPTPPGDPRTSTFEGTITTNGAMTHTFDVEARGTVTATLTEVTPDPAVMVGFALGAWNALTSTCQTVISRDDAVQGQSLVGNVSGVGTLCLRVHDPASRLTEPINYRLSVEHP